MNLPSIKSLLFVLVLLACFTNCSKDETDEHSQLSGVTVKLKSTTGQFKKVFLDIKDVQLKVENSNHPNAWISLGATNGGTYNIFDFGEDTALLLVNHLEIIPTHIYEIRLVLGDNNFVDLDNTLYALDVSDFGNANPSNLVKLDLVANRFYDFVIDINIDNSLSFDEDNNSMILNPELYTEIRQFNY